MAQLFERFLTVPESATLYSDHSKTDFVEGLISYTRTKSMRKLHWSLLYFILHNPKQAEVA
jgi:hypothetical protein